MGDTTHIDITNTHDNAGEMPALSLWAMAHDHTLALDRGRVMAILNVTPDSFSDGGAIDSPARARDAALRAVDEGADMLDIGGESTRPGAQRVPAEEQIRRVVPAIEAIRAAGIALPISVDTTLAPVAREAIEAGADAVNDVSAGDEDPAMFPLAAESGAGLILMHRLRPPDADRFSDQYIDDAPNYPYGVLADVRTFLVDRARRAESAGVSHDSILLDPGLGFGKTVPQNVELMRGVPSLVASGWPVLVGASRKSFLGALTGQPDPLARLEASVAAAVLMRMGGASVFRVHDAGPHVRALAIADSVLATTAPRQE
jgi:dihydropteroate synthase